MADVTEVAIESALLDRLRGLSFSPALTIALPNIAFTPPTAGQTTGWLRAWFLPAPTIETGLDFSASNRHQGIFQVDVMYGQGGGELAPVRIAAQIIDWFARGTSLTKDGYIIKIIRAPYRAAMMKEDPWIKVPISIPYIAFVDP